MPNTPVSAPDEVIALRAKVSEQAAEIELQIPFFMIKQSNDMISLIDGHDQRL